MASRNYYTSVVMGSTEPQPPEDGLIIWLDAGRVASYPGTGTTWFDLKNNYDFVINGLGVQNVWNAGGYFLLNGATSGAYPVAGNMANINPAGAPPAPWNSTMTVVFRIKTTDVQSIFIGGAGLASYLGAYNSGNKFFNQNAGSPTLFINGVSAANLYDNIRTGVYVTVEFSNADFSGANAFNSLYINGYPFDFTFTANTELSHFLLFNKVLTAGERTTLNTYLNS
jgi:hypothetical protein